MAAPPESTAVRLRRERAGQRLWNALLAPTSTSESEPDHNDIEQAIDAEVDRLQRVAASVDAQLLEIETDTDE